MKKRQHGQLSIPMTNSAFLLLNPHFPFMRKIGIRLIGQNGTGLEVSLLVWRYLLNVQRSSS